MTVTPLIGLDDAKRQLNINSGDSSQDDVVNNYIIAATEIINRECGYSAPTQFTEVTTGRIDASGQSRIVLARTPVLSVQSVTGQMQGLPAVDVTYLVTNPDAGTIYLSNWYAFYGPVTITYTAGRSEIPPALQTACALIVQSMWETRQGSGARDVMPGLDESGAETQGLPYEALQLMRMAPYDAAPGIA